MQPTNQPTEATNFKSCDVLVITILNWEKFQAKSNKQKSWVKIFDSIFDSTDVMDTLFASERWIYIGLIIAAARKEGKVIGTPKRIAAKLGVKPSKLIKTLPKMKLFVRVESQTGGCLVSISTKSETFFQDKNATSTLESQEVEEKTLLEREREREREGEGKTNPTSSTSRMISLSGKFIEVVIDESLLEEFKKCAGFISNMMQLDNLAFWQEEHGAENVKLALREAHDAGKIHAPRYIKAILEDKKLNGYDWKTKEKKKKESIQKVKNEAAEKIEKQEEEDKILEEIRQKTNKWIDKNKSEWVKILGVKLAIELNNPHKHSDEMAKKMAAIHARIHIQKEILKI